MDNMTYAIEDFRRRNRYGSEDIPDYLPSQEEDVFSFRHLQLHQHKKKTTNKQKQQLMQRPSMYEKILAELSQNSNSDHIQLVGSSQDLEKNINTENLSHTSSSMSGNNGLVRRQLSSPVERFSTYDRIVHELSTERRRSLDGSISVIGGGIADNGNINEDGTRVILDDYGQLQTKDFTVVTSQESLDLNPVIPNFSTLDILNEEPDSRDTLRTESSGIHFYPSKEMKNYVNNKSKLQAEGANDDHSLNQDNGKFSQTLDHNLLYQVSSMSLNPTSLTKDDNIVNNELRGLDSNSLDTNIGLYESSNQHIISSSLSDQRNQSDFKNCNLLTTDDQELQSSKNVFGSYSVSNSLELSNTKKLSSTSLLEYLSPSTNVSLPESTASQDFSEHNRNISLTESLSKEWGVSGALKGIITGVFGEKVAQTSPERAQQVKEIADLNSIFRY